VLPGQIEIHTFKRFTGEPARDFLSWLQTECWGNRSLGRAPTCASERCLPPGLQIGLPLTASASRQHQVHF